MVGSGFSKNAGKTRYQAEDPPLWRDVAQKMFNELYPEVVADPSNGSDLVQPSAENAPRIAQEYEAAFNRSGLHEFLSSIVRDEDFEPGTVHENLLKLPWRDVFTTNWDTLLEKSNAKIRGPRYVEIADMQQLPVADRSRIIKLHGSLTHKFPLIITERGL